MSQTLFLIISALGLVAALGTILARNLVHAALYLVGFFFIVACQFVLLEAEFLAAMQVLVYIGAVAIILMFGIMLTRNIQGDITTTVAPGWTFPALVAGLGLFIMLGAGINNQVSLKGRTEWAATSHRPSIAPVEGQPPSERAQAINNMGNAVGVELMTRFIVPFEVAGLLLTAALVGAIALAYREGDEESPRLGANLTGMRGTTLPLGNGHAGRGTARSDTLTTPSD